MNTKKINFIASLAAVILALMAVFVPVASAATYAQPNVSVGTPPVQLSNTLISTDSQYNGDPVSISATPESLSGPGEVIITIMITNTNPEYNNGNAGFDSNGRHPEADFFPPLIPTTAPSDVPEYDPGTYINVQISNSYGIGFETAPIPAGQTMTFSATMNVTNEQIGTDLIFNVSWFDTASNTTSGRELRLMITRSDTAYLKLTRTMSTSSAQIGDTVILTYIMVNTGSVTLNDIKLVDFAIAGSSSMLTPFSLVSGQSVRFEYSYTMGSESVVSSPTVTFTPAGSTNQLTVTASKQTIGLINTQLTKEILMSEPSPEGVQFTLYFTNNGNQRLKSLTVKDDLGKTIESGFSLAIGETKIIEYFVESPNVTRYVAFYITGTDSSGNAFTDNTLSYAVHSYIDPSLIGLDLTVEPRTQLSSDNIIGLTFTVVNTGSVNFKDISLTEQLIDFELYHIDSLQPSSEGVKFNIDFNAGSERELAFILTACDEADNTYTYEAHITAKYFDPNGAASENPPATPNISVAEDPQLGSKLDGLLTSTGRALSVWYYVLIVVAIISVIIIVSLAVVELRLRRNANDSQPVQKQKKV